jgi:hypothetical protein
MIAARMRIACGMERIKALVNGALRLCLTAPYSVLYLYSPTYIRRNIVGARFSRPIQCFSESLHLSWLQRLHLVFNGLNQGMEWLIEFLNTFIEQFIHDHV